MTQNLDAARNQVSELMPQLISDLHELVSIPSCAFPGSPVEPVQRCAERVRDLFKQAGVSDARLETHEDSSPVVMGEIKGPPNSPTVLLYAHYDVQPAPPEQDWQTNPWTPTTKPDGRIYGRGAADDKSGVVSHLGTVRALAQNPPVTLRLLIEGEEEIGSPHLEAFVQARKEYVQADAVIICDSGNQKVGEPAITTGLRGLGACKVTITTLDRAGHSGLFGGAAPDALVTLIKLLSTLHDENGDVAVKGLHAFEWEGAQIDESQFRIDAGLIDDQTPLTGSASLASRLWSRPSITVIGMDVPPIAGTPNALVPIASAKVSLRVAPGGDVNKELEVLMQHLQANVPAGINVKVTPLETGDGHLVETSTAAMNAAFKAMSAAFGKDTEALGSGGSIPAVALFTELCPSITPILWGPEDTALARIHASNESVDPAEIERIVLTQVLFASALS